MLSPSKMASGNVRLVETFVYVYVLCHVFGASNRVGLVERRAGDRVEDTVDPQRISKIDETVNRETLDSLRLLDTDIINADEELDLQRILKVDSNAADIGRLYNLFIDLQNQFKTLQANQRDFSETIETEKNFDTSREAPRQKTKFRRDINHSTDLNDHDNQLPTGENTGECTSSCLVISGPPGSPGPQGPPGLVGRDGKDGRDSMSTAVCEERLEHEEKYVADSSEGRTSNISSSVVYVRWGRRDCSNTSDLVYHGIAGGSFYDEGGGSNYLCLPQEPVYDQPAAGVQTHRGYVWGTEYQTNVYPPYTALWNHDVPCAVCKTRERSSLLMVPARNDCPSSEWTLEYFGHLMSANHVNQRTEFVCFDRNSEPLHGTEADTDGARLYAVEGRCVAGGGLPCGSDQYEDGYELTCAVCTM